MQNSQIIDFEWVQLSYPDNYTQILRNISKSISIVSLE